ncbi:MAG: class I SAM-dependent methyltransferase [Cyclobacteriaceae bacterium]|jgi:2-polyprenyl-3-methyl-5-hydroxy-6-metoxy-1,4-benzoquinol methylase
MNKKELVSYVSKAKLKDKDAFLVSCCKGKKVLDVGCIGQDRNFEKPNWLHDKIKQTAESTTGVDILKPQVEMLRTKGYSMYTPEELQLQSASFDVIVMADVIEHVNDPVHFLKYYSKFLTSDGVIFISTPNGNRSNNAVNILLNNTYSVNEEHTFWFCPKTFSEVVNRAQLEITDFHWAQHYFSLNDIKGIYQRFKYSIDTLLYKFRSNFSPNMIFILKKT